jgi:hypothetical protein
MCKDYYLCNPLQKWIVLRKKSDTDRRNKSSENTRKIWKEFIKALTFASRSKRDPSGVRKSGRQKADKIFERMEATAHKSSIYGKVVLAKEIDNMTSNFERILIVSIKQHLQWRV